MAPKNRNSWWLIGGLIAFIAIGFSGATVIAGVEIGGEGGEGGEGIFETGDNAGAEPPLEVESKVNRLRYLTERKNDPRVMFVLDISNSMAKPLLGWLVGGEYTNGNWNCYGTRPEIDVPNDGMCGGYEMGPVGNSSPHDCGGDSGGDDGLFLCDTDGVTPNPIAANLCHFEQVSSAPRECPMSAILAFPSPMVRYKKLVTRFMHRMQNYARFGLMVTPGPQTRFPAFQTPDNENLYTYVKADTTNPTKPRTMYMSVFEMKAAAGWAADAWDFGAQAPNQSFLNKTDGVTTYYLLEAVEDLQPTWFDGTVAEITEKRSCVYYHKESSGAYTEVLNQYAGEFYVDQNQKAMILAGCKFAYLDHGMQDVGVQANILVDPEYHGPMFERVGVKYRYHRINHILQDYTKLPLQTGAASHLAVGLPAEDLRSKYFVNASIARWLNGPAYGGITTNAGVGAVFPAEKTDNTEAFTALAAYWQSINTADPEGMCAKAYNVYLSDGRSEEQPALAQAVIDMRSVNTEVPIRTVALGFSDFTADEQGQTHLINDLGYDGVLDNFSSTSSTVYLNTKPEQAAIIGYDEGVMAEQLAGEILKGVTMELPGGIASGTTETSPVKHNISYVSTITSPGVVDMPMAGDVIKVNNLLPKGNPSRIEWRAGDALAARNWNTRKLFTGSALTTNGGVKGAPIRMMDINYSESTYCYTAYKSLKGTFGEGPAKRCTKSAECGEGGICQEGLCVGGGGGEGGRGGMLPRGGTLKGGFEGGGGLEGGESTEVCTSSYYEDGVTINYNGGSPFTGDKGIWDVWPNHLKDGTDISTNADYKPQSNADLDAFIKWLHGRNQSRKLHSIIGYPGVLNAPPFYPQLPEHDLFRGQNSDRRQLVIVASNIGLIHFFDEQTGKEVFAYMPAEVLPDIYNNFILYGGKPHIDPNRFNYLFTGSIRLEDVPSCQDNGGTINCTYRTVGIMNNGDTEEGFGSYNFTNMVDCSSGTCEPDIEGKTFAEFNLYNKDDMISPSAFTLAVRQHMGTTVSTFPMVYDWESNMPLVSVITGSGFQGQESTAAVKDYTWFNTFPGQTDGVMWQSHAPFELPIPNEAGYAYGSTYIEYGVPSNPISTSDPNTKKVEWVNQNDLAGRMNVFPGAKGSINQGGVTITAHDLLDPNDDGGGTPTPRVAHPLYDSSGSYPHTPTGKHVFVATSQSYYETNSVVANSPSRISSRAIDGQARVDSQAFHFDCDAHRLCTTCTLSSKPTGTDPIEGCNAPPLGAHPVESPLLYWNTTTQSMNMFSLYFKPPVASDPCNYKGTTYFIQLALYPDGTAKLVRSQKYDNILGRAVRFILDDKKMTLVHAGIPDTATPNADSMDVIDNSATGNEVEPINLEMTKYLN